jgi:hypothetical protein
MMPVDWVVRRKYETRRSALNVVLQLGRPQRAVSGEWNCCVQVVHEGVEETTEALGEDSLQALLLGVFMARARLESLQATEGLTWLGHTDLGLEIP